MHSLKRIEYKIVHLTLSIMTAVGMLMICFFYLTRTVRSLPKLNGRHANMSFAIGKEKQSRISFLDVQVIREDKTFTKCIYRTFSGVYKHIYSFLASAYMFGTAYLLAYRCFKICSCWTKLHTELSSLKQYFLKKNGYPENFTSNCFKRFTDNYSNSSKEVDNLVQYLYKLGLN